MRQFRLFMMCLGVAYLCIDFSLLADNFDQSWAQMQRYYRSLSKELEAPRFSNAHRLFYHPLWKDFSNEVSCLINGRPNRHFLNNSALIKSMVRGKNDIVQKYELCYLNYCTNSETQRLLRRFNEPSIAALPRACEAYNCSVNALGQLYYAGRIIESVDVSQVRSVAELGAGYGCLAHVLKSAMPKATIYIIDLPELLAIQYLYLKSVLPHETAHLHLPSAPQDLNKEGIHFIPVQIVDQLDLKVDIFVSNFALSEATRHVQNMVGAKNFFNAGLCYITGQINGWGSVGFEDEKVIVKNIRNQFDHVIFQPFHLFIGALQSYEIIAAR